MVIIIIMIMIILFFYSDEKDICTQDFTLTFREEFGWMKEIWRSD